jgi:site-specific DNA-methyltransferase (adenine-specific)
MIFNCLDWLREEDVPRIHPTQKPIRVLENLIRIFTDENETVIDPVAGSGATLIAAKNLNRRAYGFEIKKDFFRDAERLIRETSAPDLFCAHKDKRELRQEILDMGQS